MRKILNAIKKLFDLLFIIIIFSLVGFICGVIFKEQFMQFITGLIKV